MAYADGSWKLQVYGSSGKLLYTNHSSQGNTRHVYLGSRLIAEVNSLTGTSFSHTDALGSPVARTNSAGQVTSRTRYEPYGATAAGTNPTGIGFTGHVNDADTGLVYMQQRYYEPIAGRFLSVDPVTTDANGGSFNRYLYANGNPYRYVDPDGRQSQQPTPGEEEKKKQKEADKKKEEEAKGVRYVRTLWLKGDEGSPESDSQGLSNTAGDQLGMEIFRMTPGVNVVGCFAGTCTQAEMLFAGSGVILYGGPAARGAAFLWPAASGGRTFINGLEYTAHALARMQPVGTIIRGGSMFSRGVPPSAVENAVKLGRVTPGNSASEVVRTFENVRVVTNPEGTLVITVIKIGN